MRKLIDRAVRTTLRPAVTAIIAVEKAVFFRTGLRMRTLRSYWRWQAARLQAQLDLEHTGANA